MNRYKFIAHTPSPPRKQRAKTKFKTKGMPEVWVNDGGLLKRCPFDPVVGKYLCGACKKRYLPKNPKNV